MADSGLAGQVVVALPHGEEQDPIAEVCASMSIPVVRGHESDLLDRHLVAARAFGADVVVKVPSDCPLIDPAVMDLVIATHLANRTVSDFVSNLHPMSWPDGQDVEVVPIDVLEEAAAEARSSGSNPLVTGWRTWPGTGTCGAAIASPSTTPRISSWSRRSSPASAAGPRSRRSWVFSKPTPTSTASTPDSAV
jgi:hypothetical protein